MSQPASPNIDNLLSSIEIIYDCRHCESKKTHYRRSIEKNTPLPKMKPPPLIKIDNDNIKIKLSSSKKQPQEVNVHE